MATRATAKLVDLVIANGGTTSNFWRADEVYADADNILITRETAVDGALTFTLEVTDDAIPSAAGTWSTYQILNGAALADFAVPTVAAKAFAVPMGALAATGIRIKASGVVTGAKTFGASKQYVVN